MKIRESAAKALLDYLGEERPFLAHALIVFKNALKLFETPNGILVVPVLL